MSRSWSVAAATFNLAACCWAVASLTFPSGASASSVSLSALHSLSVAAARGNPSAIAELRQVTFVSGHPVDLDALLSSGSASELTSRIRTLETTTAPSSAAPTSAGQVRATAGRILRGDGYGKPTVPDPLADLLNDVARLVVRAASDAPGGPVLFWTLCTALALGLGGAAARRALRRRDPGARQTQVTSSTRIVDPRELERHAAEAEEAGDFDQGVRLRFQAGLLRLDSRALITYRPSLLTAEVAQKLSSPAFDELAGAFERVAYGGQHAARQDAVASRRGWEKVLGRAEAAQ